MASHEIERIDERPFAVLLPRYGSVGMRAYEDARSAHVGSSLDRTLDLVRSGGTTDALVLASARPVDRVLDAELVAIEDRLFAAHGRRSRLHLPLLGASAISVLVLLLGADSGWDPPPPILLGLCAAAVAFGMMGVYGALSACRGVADMGADELERRSRRHDEGIRHHSQSDDLTLPVALFADRVEWIEGRNLVRVEPFAPTDDVRRIGSDVVVLNTQGDTKVALQDVLVFDLDGRLLHVDPVEELRARIRRSGSRSDPSDRAEEVPLPLRKDRAQFPSESGEAHP